MAKIEELAREKRVTPSQLALAWVLHRGNDIVPIPGTKHVRYLEENVRALLADTRQNGILVIGGDGTLEQRLDDTAGLPNEVLTAAMTDTDEAVVPYLRMCGRWLEANGFSIGGVVRRKISVAKNDRSGSP